MQQNAWPTSGKFTLTLKEASDLTGIPQWTLRHHIYQKKLAVIRPGGSRGKILITPADLNAYLLRHRVAAIGESKTHNPL